MRRSGGYTLVELLMTVVVFSAIMGALFSAFLALRRVDSTRRDESLTLRLTQLALAPVVRSLQHAQGNERVVVFGQDGNAACQDVRGFYLRDSQGAKTVTPNVTLQAGDTLVTIHEQETTAKTGLPTYEWVRREYMIATRTVRSKPISVLLEREYRVFPTESFQWPNALSTCDITQVPWDPSVGSVRERQLTPDSLSVRSFQLRLNSSQATGQSFASVGITTVRNDQEVTLHTTVGGTYSGGNL